MFPVHIISLRIVRRADFPLFISASCKFLTCNSLKNFGLNNKANHIYREVTQNALASSQYRRLNSRQMAHSVARDSQIQENQPY